MTSTPGSNGCALLVAAQICDPSGVRRADPEALRLLRLAAGELSERRAQLLALPGTVAPDGVLSVTPSSPRAVVEVILAVAATVRPEHSTFCVTTVTPDDVLREHPPDEIPQSPTRDLEIALLGAHAVDASARAGLSTTDHRDSRVRVLAPAVMPAIGAALDLLLEMYDSMTERQRQIIQLVKASKTQQDVATHLGISRQAVNQSLASAHWPHLESAARHVVASLEELCGWDSGSGREESDT